MLGDGTGREHALGGQHRRDQPRDPQRATLALRLFRAPSGAPVAFRALWLQRRPELRKQRLDGRQLAEGRERELFEPRRDTREIMGGRDGVPRRTRAARGGRDGFQVGASFEGCYRAAATTHGNI